MTESNDFLRGFIPTAADSLERMDEKSFPQSCKNDWEKHMYFIILPFSDFSVQITADFALEKNNSETELC